MQLINEKPPRLWIIRPLDGSSSYSLSLFSPSFGSRVRKTPNVEREIETIERNTKQLILILILQCGKQFFSTEK